MKTMEVIPQRIVMKKRIEDIVNEKDAKNLSIKHDKVKVVGWRDG